MASDRDAVLALERVSAITRRLSVMLTAGIAPAAAWEQIGRVGGSRTSRLPEERLGSAILDAILDGYRDGVGADETLFALMRRLPGRQRAAWLPVAAAWAVAREAGAPLGAALNGIASALSAAATARRELDAVLAPARASARLMLALPPIGLVLSSGLGFDTMGLIVGTWPGRACIGAAGILVASALMWTRALIARAVPVTACPGIALQLVVIGMSAGWSADRCRARVQHLLDEWLPDTAGELAEVDDVLLLSRTAGVPVRELLAAQSDLVKASAHADSRSRAARLSVTSLLPLGLCILPAFVLSAVVPLLLSVLGSSVSSFV